MKNYLMILSLVFVASGVFAQTKFEKLMEKYKASPRAATIKDLKVLKNCYSTNFDEQDSIEQEYISVETSKINNGPQFPPEENNTVYFSNWMFEEENITNSTADLILKSPWHLVKMRKSTNGNIYYHYILSMLAERVGYCVK